ncbi:MAG: hypothetical protein LBB48_04510, partial [Treponema sp.]|nr:hypothetical protein [Treponema sp.]
MAYWFLVFFDRRAADSALNSLLYTRCSKVKKESKKPYMIKEPVDYPEVPKRVPSDDPREVKTIWIGRMKLCILLAYPNDRERTEIYRADKAAVSRDTGFTWNMPNVSNAYNRKHNG